MKNENELSTLSLAILGLISQRPMTGYDLRKVFSTTPMGHFSSSPGAIYPALKRIEEAGWIRHREGMGTTLRQRIVYEVTRSGLKTLRQHLSQPITHDDIVWRMDELMMRFAFMDLLVGRQATLRFLQDFASAIDSHAAGLRGYLDGVRDSMPLCGRLALENGIEGYETDARWARRAMDELQRGA